jgi:hypothetical protein
MLNSNVIYHYLSQIAAFKPQGNSTAWATGKERKYKYFL